MQTARYVIAAALPLLIAACGGTTSRAVGPDPVEPLPDSVIHPELKDLRDAASELAGNWARRDGYAPPTLDGDQLRTHDTATARIADRELRSEILSLDEEFEWGSDRTVVQPPPGLDNETFTPVGEESGAELAMYTARWTTSPGYLTTLRLGWGAWLDESRFGAVRDVGLLEEHGVKGSGLFAYSNGRATQGLQEGGGATYRGIAVAHRTSGLESHADLVASTGDRPLAGLLFGKARIEANFGSGTVDVAIHDMVDIAANAPAKEAGVMWRGIPISHRTMSFENDTSSLDMSFYGRNGAEVGGVFRTETMVGAFGAERAPSGE